MITDLVDEDLLSPGSGQVGGTAPPPERRGTTRVAPRVVEKIAATAADEADDVAGGPHGSRRRGSGSRGGVRVEATIREHGAEIAVVAVVYYPVVVRDIADDLRARITWRVEELTGIRVDTVDIDISGFVLQRQERVR